MDTTQIAPVAQTATWLAALARARTEGIKLYRSDAGDYYAESSDGSKLYAVSLTGCACKAGERGIACKHRASLGSALGVIADDRSPEPEPPAPAVAPEPEPVCHECDGRGWTPMYTGGGLNDYWVITCRCQRRHAA